MYKNQQKRVESAFSSNSTNAVLLPLFIPNCVIHGHRFLSSVTKLQSIMVYTVAISRLNGPAWVHAGLTPQ